MIKESCLLLTVAATAASMLFSGCSTSGWSSKDIPDGSNIRYGENITVVQKDGSVLRGIYSGMEEIPVSDYGTYYNTSISQASLDHVLPQFGDNIQFTTRIDDNKVWEGQFLGFDSKNISVRLKGKSEREEFYVSSLDVLSKTHGNTLEMMQFRKLYADGKIPLRSAILLNNGNGGVKIPLNTVEKITPFTNLPTSLSSE